MTAGDFGLLMQSIAWMMGQFFNCLKSVHIGDYSLFSILCAILFLDVVFWFISKILGKEYHRSSDALANPPEHTQEDVKAAEAAYGRVAPSDAMVKGYERGSFWTKGR